MNIPEHRFWGRYLDAAGLYKRAESVYYRAAWEQGPLFRRSWGRFTRCRGLHTVQAESVVPEGRQSNGDRYSVTSVSTDSATGKPWYATASHIQKWSHDWVHGGPGRLGKTRTARKIRADTVNMTRAYGTVSRVANGTEVHPTRTLIFAAEVPTSCHSYLGRAKLIIYSRTYNFFL